MPRGDGRNGRMVVEGVGYVVATAWTRGWPRDRGQALKGHIEGRIKMVCQLPGKGGESNTERKGKSTMVPTRGSVQRGLLLTLF